MSKEKGKLFKAEDYMNLPHGVYKVYWLTGGSSTASVGYDFSGRKWFAPSNWINMDKSYIDEHIHQIESFKLIKENKH